VVVGVGVKFSFRLTVCVRIEGKAESIRGGENDFFKERERNL